MAATVIDPRGLATPDDADCLLAARASGPWLRVLVAAAGDPAQQVALVAEIDAILDEAASRRAAALPRRSAMRIL